MQHFPHRINIGFYHHRLLLGNTCLAILQEMSGEYADDALVAFYDAALHQFADACQRRG